MEIVDIMVLQGTQFVKTVKNFHFIFAKWRIFRQIFGDIPVFV
jgi:hypothetical protein